MEKEKEMQNEHIEHSLSKRVFTFGLEETI